MPSSGEPSSFVHPDAPFPSFLHADAESVCSLKLESNFAGICFSYRELVREYEITLCTNVVTSRVLLVIVPTGNIPCKCTNSVAEIVLSLIIDLNY
jgi:hypothetical protein